MRRIRAWEQRNAAPMGRTSSMRSNSERGRQVRRVYRNLAFSKTFRNFAAQTDSRKPRSGVMRVGYAET